MISRGEIQRRFAACLALIGLLSLAPAVRAAEAAVLSVEGVKPAPVEFSLSELRAFPSSRATVEFPANRKSECEGIRLADILVESGLAMGKALAGPRLTETLVISARDGYSAAFVLTELDPEFTHAPVMLCLALDGAPISDETGPLRIIVPNEQKRHARWVRQVTRFTLRKGS